MHPHGAAVYLGLLMLLCAVLTRRDAALCAMFTVLLVFFALVSVL